MSSWRDTDRGARDRVAGAPVGHAVNEAQDDGMAEPLTHFHRDE